MPIDFIWDYIGSQLSIGIVRRTFTPYHRDKFRGQKNVDDVFAVNDRRDTYTISANGRHMAWDLITNFQDGDTIDLPGDYENGGSFIKPIFKTKSGDKNLLKRAQVIRPGQVGCIQLENGYYLLIENRAFKVSKAFKV